MSLGVELHGWRGINTDSDLFLRWVRLGFVSFSFSRGSLIDRLLKIMERVK